MMHIKHRAEIGLSVVTCLLILRSSSKLSEAPEIYLSHPKRRHLTRGLLTGVMKPHFHLTD